MANMDNLIEPGRQGTWVAATFVVALLALVVAIVGVKRNSELLYMTQTELLLVNQKIEALQGGKAPPAAAAPAAPAAAAE
nr:hypothetical protein [uncultured Methylotenera sp.]